MPTLSSLEPISAAEANRNFSRLLREVRAGKGYLVTSHGRPVAQLTSVEAGADQTRAAPRDALLKRLESQPAKIVSTWTREELYER
jgi:prevent-host-death family protein